MPLVRDSRRPLSLALVLAIGFLLAAIVPSANAAVGGLTQKPGTAGCLANVGGAECSDGNAMGFVSSVTISPDGKSAYATAPNSFAIGVFDRDTTTGALTQKAGADGCIAESNSPDGCADGSNLQAPLATVVSPDGKNVYAAVRDSGAILVFDRDTANGIITQKAGTAGCISDTGNGGTCVDGSALDGTAAVDVSPDGKNVYAVTFGSDSVVVFDRDATTGALTQKAAAAGCISDTGAGGCTDGAALDGASDIEVAPDGKSVYVASNNSDSVAVFDRDTTTGALTQKTGTAGCISEFGGDGCADGRGVNGAASLVASPDGTSVYAGAGAGGGSVAVFDRNTTTGALTQKAGTSGCVSETGSGGECADGVGLSVAGGVDVSPDGANVYVASQGSAAVAILDRSAGGALTQKAGTAGCIADTPVPGVCADGREMLGLGAVTVAPEGGQVYAVAQTSAAIDIFDRDLVPDTTIDSGPSGTTADPTPTFTFSSGDAGSTFECKIDAAAFAPCSGPGASHTTAELANGAHTFSVRAVDPAANVDPTPATRAFTVDVPDTTAPETTITKKPKSKLKTKGKSVSVSVSFSSEAGATFECRLDDKAFKSCTSPFTAKAKSKGRKGLRHTIEVRAIDAAANVEATPAAAKFTVIRKG